MPSIFQSIARECGIDIEVDSVTGGGRRLCESAAQGDELGAKICDLAKRNDYDILFLQEQSHTPVSSYKDFLYGVEALTKLVCAKRVILYVTWGRKEGAELLKTLNLTSLGMTLGLEMAYSRAAKICGAELSCVGRAFAALGAEHPEIELYQNDLSHPSFAGSLLAALVHFKTAFGKMPQRMPPLEIDAESLSAIMSIVDGL